MSQENVEIVNGFHDAYNRRDREAVAALFHPEIEWHTVAGPILGVEVLHGREAVLTFIFEQIPDALPDFRVTVQRVSALPDGQVLVANHYEGRGVTSGAAVEMRVEAIFRIETGMIVFFQEFASRAEALEAAALSE
jgi:ketosteroid isomerase-like protein